MVNKSSIYLNVHEALGETMTILTTSTSILPPYQEMLYLGSRKCDQKKSPNVYKSCLKMISLEKI